MVPDRLFGRIEGLFRDMGWNVVTLKYGRKLEAAFAREDGEHLRRWIDDCPNSLYSALTFQGGAAWRATLLSDLGRIPGIRAIVDPLSDEELGALMTNLGGHDIETLLEAFRAQDAAGDQPTCFIAYTIKGMGLPFAGHKDNHAGLMTKEQMAGFKAEMGIRDGHEWDPFEGLEPSEAELRAFLDACPSPGRLAPEGRRARGSRPCRCRRPFRRRRCRRGGSSRPSRPSARCWRRSAAGSGRGRGAGAADRHHQPGRDGLDQPRTLGEPARHLRPASQERRLPRCEACFRAALGHVAGGPAHRARHRRAEPVPAAVGARPRAFAPWRAAAADRHGLRPVREPRPRCAHLCLLPGCEISSGFNAFRADPRTGRRPAPVGQHAADRHRPGPAGELRAGAFGRAWRS